MPKFSVTIVKEVWERAEIEVNDAVDVDRATCIAIDLAANDPTIKWRWKETRDYDAIEIEPVSP